MSAFQQFGATAPGQDLPRCDKARWQARNVGEQVAADTADSADNGAHSKALASMQRRAAECGCTVHEMADGGFLVSKWGCSKSLPCLRTVGDLLRRIGGDQ